MGRQPNLLALAAANVDRAPVVGEISAQARIGKEWLPSHFIGVGDRFCDHCAAEVAKAHWQLSTHR